MPHNWTGSSFGFDQKDLHMANMLYDHQRGRITAVHDWEFSGVVPFPEIKPSARLSFDRTWYSSLHGREGSSPRHFRRVLLAAERHYLRGRQLVVAALRAHVDRRRLSARYHRGVATRPRGKIERYCARKHFSFRSLKTCLIYKLPCFSDFLFLHRGKSVWLILHFISICFPAHGRTTRIDEPKSLPMFGT